MVSIEFYYHNPPPNPVLVVKGPKKLIVKATILHILKPQSVLVLLCCLAGIDTVKGAAA